MPDWFACLRIFMSLYFTVSALRLFKAQKQWCFFCWPLKVCFNYYYVNISCSSTALHTTNCVDHFKSLIELPCWTSADSYRFNTHSESIESTVKRNPHFDSQTFHNLIQMIWFACPSRPDRLVYLSVNVSTSVFYNILDTVDYSRSANVNVFFLFVYIRLQCNCKYVPQLQLCLFHL